MISNDEQKLPPVCGTVWELVARLYKSRIFGWPAQGRKGLVHTQGVKEHADPPGLDSSPGLMGST